MSIEIFTNTQNAGVKEKNFFKTSKTYSPPCP